MKKVKGMSLLELLLVIAIASMILIMGLRQYQTYKLDTDVSLLKYNVDTLFVAMSSYFQANCGGATGTLSPFNRKTPPDFKNPLTLDIKTQLVDDQYLAEDQIVPVALVAGSAEKETAMAGYRVRFVPKRVTRSAPVDQDKNTWDQSVGQIIIWTPEIMVMLQDPAKAVMLKILTGALSCTTKDWSAGNCDQTSTNALLFSHQVSFSSHVGGVSDFWLMNPTLSQLRDQEGNYNPMAVMSVGAADQQFYYCGS